MQQRVFAVSFLLALLGAATPVVAAEFWVSQDPQSKRCKIVATVPDGKTTVMIGATSYPNKADAKAARKVAVEAGQCIKEQNPDE
jgi:hypothetical protein